MRKNIIVVTAILGTLLLAGCDTSVIAPTVTDGVASGDALIVDDEQPVMLLEENTEFDDSEAPEPVFDEELDYSYVDGRLVDSEGTPIVQSYLNGKLLRLNEQEKRPLAVMMNNIEAGTPQCGIASADIVYEFPVEGRITRLMGLFQNYDKLPERIGSIRSSRDYFVYTALEYDAIYAHFGQATMYVGELLNSPTVDNISGAVSGIETPATNAFFRTSDRKAPHNVFISRDGIWSDIEKFGYRTILRQDYQPKFTFPEYGERVEYAGAKDATRLYPGGKETGKANGFSSVQARFEYNPEDGKYYRYEYGKEHIDGDTGEQLTYDNVIFQYVHGEVRDSHDYLAFGLMGDAGYKVQVFTNGKMVEGTWSRSDETPYKPALYIDNNGKPITINTGKTWVCMIWDEYSDDVVIE